MKHNACWSFISFISNLCSNNNNKEINQIHGIQSPVSTKCKQCISLSDDLISCEDITVLQGIHAHFKMLHNTNKPLSLTIVNKGCILNDGARVLDASVTKQVCLVCFSSRGYYGSFLWTIYYIGGDQKNNCIGLFCRI